MIHLSFIFQQPIDKTEEHKKIILIQLLHAGDCLLNQFGILRILIEKLLRCEFKVFTDGEKFLHRGQSLARRYIINISNCGSGTIKRIKVERIVIDCEDIFSYDNEQLRRGAPQIQGTYRIKSDDGKLYMRIDCQYLVPVEKIKTYNAIRQADAKKGLLLTNIEMHLRLFALNGFEYKEVLKIYTDMERIDEEERYFVRSDVELLEPIID